MFSAPPLPSLQDAFVVAASSVSLDVSHRRIGALKVRLLAAPAGASPSHPPCSHASLKLVACRDAWPASGWCQHSSAPPPFTPFHFTRPPPSLPRLQITLTAQPFSSDASSAYAHPTIVLKSHGLGRCAGCATGRARSVPVDLPVLCLLSPGCSSARRGRRP